MVVTHKTHKLLSEAGVSFEKCEPAEKSFRFITPVIFSSLLLLLLLDPPSLLALSLSAFRPQLLGAAPRCSDGHHRAAVSAAGGPGHGGYQGYQWYDDGRAASPADAVSPNKLTALEKFWGEKSPCSRHHWGLIRPETQQLPDT